MRGGLLIGIWLLVVPTLAWADAPEDPAAPELIEAVRPPPPSRGKLLGFQLAAGAGAALVSTPIALYTAAAVGSLSNRLVLAALPAFIVFLAIPALAVTAAQWAVGNNLSPGSVSFQPAVWIATAVNLAVLVVSIVLAASVQKTTHVVGIAVASAVLLPVAVTLAVSF